MKRSYAHNEAKAMPSGYQITVSIMNAVISIAMSIFSSVNLKHTTESGKILTLSDKRLTDYA